MILAFLFGGVCSRIPTSLSSLELSLALEISSSSELSSLDESELDPDSELLPSDLGLFPTIIMKDCIYLHVQQFKDFKITYYLATYLAIYYVQKYL